MANMSSPTPVPPSLRPQEDPTIITPSAPNTPTPKIISDRAVDEPRPVKVIYIGAGISGILAGIRIPERVQNLDLRIYDKNEELGGTWWENKYVGTGKSHEGVCADSELQIPGLCV